MTSESSARSVGDVVVRAVLVFGVVGLVAGFVRGLTVHAPTAWAAAFEVGIPAAVIGVVIGFGVVGLLAVARRVQRPTP